MKHTGLAEKTTNLHAEWWPMFCLTYDIAAAGYLAWLLKSSKVSDVAALRSQR
jgi:hypothetical protein